jgi:hypothetical protein
MKKKYTLEIPEFLTISKHQELQNLEHLSELGKLIEAIHVFTGITRDELKTWSIPDLGRVAKDYSSIDTQEQFYPLIKLNDKTYGYADISTMTLAEFIDLENLCKKPNANLHEIMAVLYREVKSHKFNNFIWNVKHNVQISRNKVDNVFKWYKLEKYDSTDRAMNAIIMKELPISLALGALSFFLVNRQSTLSKFDQLFGDASSRKSDDKESEESESGGFNSHWGWFATIYALSKTNILSITGDKSITELNLGFVLNYLAIEKDYNEIERQQQKSALAQSKNRTRLK